MFINIVFWLGSDRLSGFLSFGPAVLFFILTPLFLPSSSVSLSYYFIIAVNMRECLGKHSCMSSPFPTAILNGTSFFLSLVQDNLNIPSGHCYRLCSWSGRSNYLIKNKKYSKRRGGWVLENICHSVFSRHVISTWP